MSVDVCGFAVMSNHVHLVVRIRPGVAASWSAEEVVRRWWKVNDLVRPLDGSHGFGPRHAGKFEALPQAGAVAGEVGA